MLAKANNKPVVSLLDESIYKDLEKTSNSAGASIHSYCLFQYQEISSSLCLWAYLEKNRKVKPKLLLLKKPR